jgi:hypothetical protein
VEAWATCAMTSRTREASPSSAWNQSSSSSSRCARRAAQHTPPAAHAARAASRVLHALPWRRLRG